MVCYKRSIIMRYNKYFSTLLILMYMISNCSNSDKIASEEDFVTITKNNAEIFIDADYIFENESLNVPVYINIDRETRILYVLDALNRRNF